MTYVAYYLQIAADLRAKIMAGDLKKHDYLPSARLLAEQWGVATMTARGAVKLLEREGLVAGRQGKGVVVVYDPAAPVGLHRAAGAAEGAPPPGVTFGPPEGRHRREGTWICVYVPPSVDEEVADNIADDIFKGGRELGWPPEVVIWTAAMEE